MSVSKSQVTYILIRIINSYWSHPTQGPLRRGLSCVSQRNSDALCIRGLHTAQTMAVKHLALTGTAQRDWRSRYWHISCEGNWAKTRDKTIHLPIYITTRARAVATKLGSRMSYKKRKKTLWGSRVELIIQRKLQRLVCIPLLWGSLTWIHQLTQLGAMWGIRRENIRLKLKWPNVFVELRWTTILLMPLQYKVEVGTETESPY